MLLSWYSYRLASCPLPYEAGSLRVTLTVAKFF